MMTNLIFRRFTVGSFGINGYLVADHETRIGVFIDPGGFSAEIEAFIEERQIVLNHLFFTHGHWDHTEGIPAFESRYTVPRAMPAREKSVSLSISYRAVRYSRSGI